MSSKKPSIDGFIPRRTGSQLGDLHKLKNPDRAVQPIDRELHTGDNIDAELVGVARVDKTIGIGRSDIDQSLREIDDVIPDKKAEKKRRREAKVGRPKNKVVRIIKWTIICLAIIAALVGGYVVLKAVLASNGIFKGSIFDLVQNQPLKMDANGRSNFLILGTSEDDPGHEAGYLTDSILVISIDQKAKNAFMFSIPRDLYVKYGQACLSGYSGKINTYFSCVNDGTTDAEEQARLSATQKFVGDIVGMDIQYGAHVNYTVMRDVVNAIGGSITVTIDSRDPRGQMDSNFDWKCGATYAQKQKSCPPSGHYIDYPNGPVTLDAEHALYLAQARGDIAPTYGFEQSNFDRERNQQKILVAIKEKALSAGTLTNVAAVTQLLDALGKNLRTNIETKEIRTLMQLGIDIKSADIQSVDLYKEGEAVFTTETTDATGSVVIPKAGEFDYSGLQAYLAKNITSDPVVKEAPHITVLNGSGTAGAAQAIADKLTAANFTVDYTGNAPDGTYPAITIYQLNAAKTASAAKLNDLYGVTLLTTKPPVSVVGASDFLIIVGTSGQ